jgi:hypothetical protein
MSEGAVNMDLILRALLFATLNGMPVSERIEVLGSAGWTNPQIGAAVGLSANAVQLRRSAKKEKA